MINFFFLFRNLLNVLIRILLDFITVIINCSHEYLILFKKFNTLDIILIGIIVLVINSRIFINQIHSCNKIIKQFKKIKKL